MRKEVLDSTIKLKDNAMLKHRPNFFQEWDFEKNDELNINIYKVAKSSNFKVWWNCKKCGSNYGLKISHKTDGSGCRYCSGQAVNHTNSLATLMPEIASEWHPTKNGTRTPHDVTLGNDTKAWWTCPKCKSDYNMTVNKKTLGQDCSYCNGSKVNHTNSLATLRPNLIAEWHPTKNGEKTPHDVTVSMNGKVWWIGKCGHEWEASTNSRTRQGTESGCPYCATSNARVLKGFNDIWTTNPELAKLLADPEDGYKYLQMSGKRLDFQCLDCEKIIKNRVVSSIAIEGLSCPRCSDGIRFPEKFMYNLLKEANIDFIYDETQDWSQNKRYDFYLPEYNWIIETHGEQHYGASFERMRGNVRNLSDEQENDKFKEKLAKGNKVDNYIVIDTRESTVEWISNNILNSDIMNIVASIDFERIGQLASSSFIKIACDLWNSGIHSTLEIGKTMKINRTTATVYLKRGAEIGWCDYSTTRKVVQLDTDLNFLSLWESSAEAGRCLNVSQSHISSVCLNKRHFCGGFRWMYEEDYKKMIKLVG